MPLNPVPPAPAPVIDVHCPVTIRANADGTDRHLTEEKMIRKKAMRDRKTAERREKRHEKAEAKRARKLNVQRAGKWRNPEFKAADKAKKLANRPHKQEKRRKKMLLRADKLERQAKKLMAEAQIARARYHHLTKLKEVNQDALPGRPLLHASGHILVAAPSRASRRAVADALTRPCYRMKMPPRSSKSTT
jgi:hypothetical protein